MFDLGCATGMLTTRIAATGRSVIGIDRSPTMIRLAHERCDGDARVRLVRGDLTALPRLPKAGWRWPAAMW